ncbi:MAG TPA: hypothetical protein VMH80_15650 [Bryobacteraceae bacterium]|nr:hypothetical protein [Bryobacteraceae bacterium]
MDDLQTQFDQAYWASQPPEVQAVAAITDQQQRAAQAATLASKGFTIDVPIMVWNWDPYLTMNYRVSFGFTWVPSALQPQVTVAPGVPPLAGLIAYDPSNPPAGSIKVSTNPADYPPYVTPAPPTPVPANSDPVGLQSVGNLYLSTVGDNYPDGAQYTDARGTFVKHVTITPFGRTNYWEKIA